MAEQLYFLDTNICSYFSRGMYPAIQARMADTSPRQIKIPSVVLAEVLTDVEKRQSAKFTDYWRRFFQPFEIVPFDEAAARQYGYVRALLEAKGQKIGPNDTIIAATVLARSGTLVTRNVGEFARVPGLHIEDWTIPPA